MDNSIFRNGIGRRDFLKGSAALTAAGVLAPQVSIAQQDGTPTLAGDNSYAAKLTAAGGSPSNVPQRPGPAVAIDVHCHWAPEVYMKAKADLGRPDFINASNHDLPLRVKWMDDHGEKTQVLTLGGFMPWQWVSEESGGHIAQITNDAALEAHNAYPDRFLYGIELPVGYPEVALKELNRVAGKPGAVAVHLPNSLAGREYLFEPAFAPVLARIQDIGIPILMHPLDGIPNFYAGGRLNDPYSGNNPNGAESLFPGLTNSMGETFEQATTVAKLIVSGTMDRYPTLNIIIAHAGGAFPYIVGRLDRGGAGRLKQPVHAYIRRFHFDDLAWYPLTLKYLIDLVGSDRVVVGTDNMGGTAGQQGGANGPNAPAPGGAAAGGGQGGQGGGQGGGRNGQGGQGGGARAGQGGGQGGGQNAGGGAGVAGPNSVLDQLNLPQADRDLILFGNAKRLFKLS